ncbi:MAG: FecR domain-containing protein [Kofleriaceae bacterium]
MNRLLVLVITLIVTPAFAEPTVDYSVKDGDTCLGIAIGVLGDRVHLATIHRLNPQLGKTPHDLKPGQILVLPSSAQKPDATLARTYNTVELRRAGADTWSPAAVGAELFRAWRVGARERSNARVVFADRSAIEMRENTVVVIYGASSRAVSDTPRRATLETGALRSRLAELDGRSLQVQTTAGEVAVAAGSAIVEVVSGGRTLVSNHAGKVATLRNKSGATKIDAGFGADAEPNKKPSPPRPLPPPPSWASVSTLATGWRATGATLRATWSASTQAARYRIELATTSGDVLAQLEVPGSTNAIELHRIPAGTYVLAIGSVDTTGLEGVAAMSAPIEARLLALANEGEPTPIGIVDATTVSAPRTVLLGTVLASAPDVTCVVEKRSTSGSSSTNASGSSSTNASGGANVFAHAGDATVTCVRGTSRVEIPVIVAPITLSASQTGPLALDTPIAIDIALAPMPPPGDLVARAEAGFVVDRVERTPTGARVHVTPRRIGAGTLALSLATAAGTVELGRTAIDTRAPDASPKAAKPVEAPQPRVWLGLAGGAAIDGPARIAGAIDLHVGVVPLFAFEVGGVVSEDRQTVELGGALRYRVGRVTPMLRAGLAIDDDVRVGFHAGVAIRVDLAGRFAGYGRVGTTGIGKDLAIDALVGLAIALDP